MNLKKFERYPLTFGKTPIDYLPRLSKEINGDLEIYAKRDDCNSGLAFGGNKTRHLEFIMHKAKIGDYDCVLTGAATQSNWCRQTVAAANKLGLETFLVLVRGVKSNQMQGNFLFYDKDLLCQIILFHYLQMN